VLRFKKNALMHVSNVDPVKAIVAGFHSFHGHQPEHLRILVDSPFRHLQLLSLPNVAILRVSVLGVTPAKKT
jgi:hypothetical protein